MASINGETLGKYRILSEIGKGGMGEVYLAQDTELDRKVAIKFLSDEFSNDTEKLNRFVQEAKAASALNHPNIITIHEIGETDNAQYLALEYIEGETLTKRLNKQLKFNEALDIATQIASALDAAHAAGIVHRDIKPDNVMIRNDRLVKILDFGIAKLIESGRPEVESEDKTAVQVNTTPGMIIGTANYMSPEQAKGKEVDTRTDIFSFGVVLYEMVTGRLPFEGETPMEMIGSIMKDEPQPLNSPEIPAEIKRIIGKSLKKDPDDRYQTVKGLLADLKEARRELEVQDKLEKTAAPESGNEPQTQILRATTAGDQRQTTNVTNQSRGSLRMLLLVSGVVGIVAIVFSAGWYFMAAKSPEVPFAKIENQEIATAAVLNHPIISADGKFIAYTKANEFSFSIKKELVLRQTGSGAENVIYEKSDGFVESQTFSPDGESIYFNLSGNSETQILYRISVLGGTPKKILENHRFSRIAISPDGKKIVYETRDDSKRPVFHMANSDGSEREEILKAEDINADGMDIGGWSPDGNRFLFDYSPDSDSGKSGDARNRRILATLDMDNITRPRKDRIRTFIDDTWSRFGKSEWMPDGKGVFLSASKFTGNRQLWHLSYPEGKISRITNDTNDYANARVSRDGRSIVAVTELLPASIWEIDLLEKTSRQVTPDNKRISPTSLTSFKGRFYYAKSQVNGDVIFSANKDGSDEKMIFNTSGPNRNFKITPDGKYVVVDYYDIGPSWKVLYRFNADGSDRIQLTDAEGGVDLNPQITADGYVFFQRRMSGSRNRTEIMRVPIAGGKAEKIELESSYGNFDPSLSPNGKYLAYEADIKDQSTGKISTLLRVVEFENGKAGKKVLEKEVPEIPRIRWTPESDAIIYERTDKESNLFKLSIADKTETQITDFNLKADSWDFTWSDDGKKIYAFRTSRMSNLVLIKDVTGGEGL